MGVFSLFTFSLSTAQDEQSILFGGYVLNDIYVYSVMFHWMSTLTLSDFFSVFVCGIL